jgi:nucleotidyltransferase/DNA polymerase involved in DNA repair
VRVACVWLPELPMRVEVLRNPKLADRPLVVGGGPGQRHVVALCSAAAVRAGIRPGLPLREVVPLCPEAVVIPPDPIRTAGVLDAVAGALERVGPVVEAADEALYLDLGGLERLYRGDLANLARAMRRAVPSLLLPQLGAGGGKFAALAAARSRPNSSLLPLGEGQDEGVGSGCEGAAQPMPLGDALTLSLSQRERGRGGMVVVPANETRAFLAPLPIDWLPIAPDQVEWLRRLGLRTIGELAAMPVGAVQAQLGPAGARAWRLARGRDDEPVVPRQPLLSVRTALRFDDPLASEDAVFFALDQLLARAFADPLMRARSARQARLGALLSDRSAWERVVTFKEPISDPTAARRALRAKLELPNALPPAPIEELSLDLLGLASEAARQGNLFVDQAQTLGRIAAVANQLGTRYSRVPLYQAVAIERWSRVPEHRWALVPLVQREHRNADARLADVR